MRFLMTFASAGLLLAYAVTTWGCDSEADDGDTTGGSASSGLGPNWGRGDPAAGKVRCYEDSCDLAQQGICCIWPETLDPYVVGHDCLPDCSTVEPAPGTIVEDIDCDGPEDCDGNACCDGHCFEDVVCVPGPSQACHVNADCEGHGNCCAQGSQGIGACATSDTCDSQ